MLIQLPPMTSQPGRSFAEVHKTARVAKGLTQLDEAAKLGLKQPAVSAWESGRSYPTPENLVEIADLLDLDLGELVRLIAAEARDPGPVDPQVLAS